MKKSKGILDDLLQISGEVFPEHSEEIEQQARSLYADYCKGEENKSKEITMHTVKKIFPCIAFYKSVIRCTGQKDMAYDIVNNYFARECQKVSKQLQRICRIPFLYKLVPYVMARTIHKTFGEKSGFQMIDKQTDSRVCAIDMIGCPYYSNCKELGCPELTTTFCNGDDVAYGNMHPKLSWERKKTLGRGNECCDFYLQRDKSNGIGK